MIRIANKGDVARIAEIDLFVRRFSFKDILSNDFLYGKLSYEYLKEWFTGSFIDMENNRGIKYYVLEDKNIIKGYFSIGFPPNNKECELIDFLIDVPFQKNGFGALLMDYLMNIVKDMEVITLGVFEKNFIAIRFYEKYGFKMESKHFAGGYNTNIIKYKKEIK